MEDIQKYGKMLEEKMMVLERSEGITCNNPKCSDKVHMKEIDNNVLEVLIGIVESSYCYIHIVGKDERQPSKNNKVIPNWEEEVKPFRNATIYWHAQWVNKGREKEGWLYETMVQKRKDYHLGDKRCQANANKLKAETAL